MINVKCLDTWYEVSVIDFVENFNKYSQYCTEAYMQVWNISETSTEVLCRSLDLNKLKQVLK